MRLTDLVCARRSLYDCLAALMDANPENDAQADALSRLIKAGERFLEHLEHEIDELNEKKTCGECLHYSLLLSKCLHPSLPPWAESPKIEPGQSLGCRLWRRN